MFQGHEEQWPASVFNQLGKSWPKGGPGIATGAWYAPGLDPDLEGTCLHGNPNMLTSDSGTSSLTRGPAARAPMGCLTSYPAMKDSTASRAASSRIWRGGDFMK